MADNQIELGDFCSVDSGFAFKSEQFSENANDVFLVKGSNLGHRSIAWEEGPWWDIDDFDDLKRYQLHEHDVLLAMDRPIVSGQLKYAWIKQSDPKALLVQRVARLKANDSEDQLFLRYIIASPAFLQYIDIITTGVNVPHISGPDIRKYEFLLPELKKRRKVAAVLSAYDDLIENNLKRIKLLEETAQITYEDWFIRLKFPGHENTKAGSKTGLPDGWNKAPLGQVIILNYGKSLRAEERNGGGVPVYGSAGIMAYHNKSLVTAPGIIVGRKGNVGSVFWSHDDFFPIDTVYYVESKLSLYFCYFALRYVEFINNDAAVPGLNRNAAYAMKIIIPPATIASQFEEQVKPVFKTINNLQKQNKLLKEARDILLPRLMTGMIDVDKINIPTELIERVTQTE